MMATSQNANQFIGSKISLISKSEIRYEGILYSLDLQDATISLAKVKSFGTEERNAERPVPCKDEIYEFIIFRGSDIKGIDVLEPPKAAATLTCGLPNDPAIVEVSHYSSSSQPGHAAGSATASATHMAFPGGSVPGGYSAAFPSSSLGSVKPQQSSSELHSSGLEHPGGISVVPGDSNAGSTHEASRSNASTPTLHSRKSPTIAIGIQVGEDGDKRNNRQFNRQGDGRGSRQSSQDRRRQPHQHQHQQQGNDRQAYQPRGRGNYVNNRGGFRGGRGGNRGGYRSQSGIISAQLPPKVTFEEEYNFEKANEEIQAIFSKLKLESDDAEKKEGEQNGEGNAENEEQENKEPAEPFYVKDSFYDKISCESTERSKGKNTRVDWRAERKLNAETFGLPKQNYQRQGNYPRGGGYRGYRGGYGGQPRGNYQMGRGGYNNYNSGYDGYRNQGGYYQYNNRYNNGGRGGSRGYRPQQQHQPQTQQQEQAAQ